MGKAGVALEQNRPTAPAQDRKRQAAPVRSVNYPDRSWQVPCPRCGDFGELLIDLNNLGPEGAITCGHCSHQFTIMHVRTVCEGWGPVIEWLDLIPVNWEKAEDPKP